MSFCCCCCWWWLWYWWLCWLLWCKDLAIYGPYREKTCLRGFWQNETQTSLLSHRDELENWYFIWRKFRYNTFQKANNKGADQTAQMPRLVCAFVVSQTPKDRFSRVKAHIWLYNPFTFCCIFTTMDWLWERSSSVVECLTQDRRAAGLSLTGVTALCPWARTLILA